jgi:hypothetical protein
MNFLRIAESIISNDMKCQEIYGLKINEMKYKHTLWITDKGKVLDISDTRRTHHDWAAMNKDKFKKQAQSPFAMTASSGWIKVRNGVTLDLEGMRDAIHKNRKTIMEVVDGRIFDENGRGKFSMMIQELDKDGSVNKRLIFSLPRDDSKLRRYL